MTSTEAVSLSNKEVRAAWISDLVRSATLIPQPGPALLWEGLLLVMLQDGPELCSELNTWWPRRFSWIRSQMAAGRRDYRQIAVIALRDMKFANDNDGR